MTEKEKMEQSILYDANYDKELIKERLEAKDICYEYNHIKPSNLVKRKKLLQKLLGKIEGECWIEPDFYCDYGYHIVLGENFYSNHNLVILDAAKVKFGRNVFIGPNCGFYTSGHPLDKEKRNQGLEYAKPISIGSDVWIGGNVIVLPGVSIGDNVIIGAGSIVTKDIPSGVVAYGNPCRVVKKMEGEL